MKKEIREKILYKRTSQSPDDKAPKDEKILQTLEELPEFQKAKNIMVYIAIHGEVDLEKLFHKYKEEKNFILPRVEREKNALHLFHVKSLDDLVKGSFSISEPTEGMEQIEPEELNLIIVPGVAFANDGHRIGYGGGFYDRLLKKLTCPKIGVAYEFQIVENVHGEEHDESVDIIVTEANTIRISKP